MKKKESHSPFSCHQAVKNTLAVIGGKWKALILWHLFEKKMRFNELEKNLPGISQKMLSSQLKDLVKEGIVHREVYRQVPPKVEYWITDYGLSLKTMLLAAAKWGEKHANKVNKKK